MEESREEMIKLINNLCKKDVSKKEETDKDLSKKEETDKDVSKKEETEKDVFEKDLSIKKKVLY